MRTARSLALSLAVLLVLPATALHAQRVGIGITAQMGPALDISLYSSNQFGDWHRAYRTWTPVRVYYMNGRYYRRPVRGARLVIVYSDGHHYFFPPRDDGWNHFDRRYDYRYRPTDDDYRARGDGDPGVLVLDYRPDRYGDWHQNYHEWQAVTLYQVGGRYYDHELPGSRAVMLYHYRDGYFLPPRDRDWGGADHRFDQRPDRGDHQDQGNGRDEHPDQGRGRNDKGRGQDRGRDHH